MYHCTNVPIYTLMLLMLLDINPILTLFQQLLVQMPVEAL